MTDEILINTEELEKRRKMALGGSGLLLTLGIFLVLTYRNYLDIGHLPLCLIYIVLCFFVFRALNQARIVFSIVCIALCALMMFMTIAKIRWNQVYLEDLATTNAFMFEDYITKYPRLEQYYFSRTLREPDWIRLAQNCALPALRNQPVEGFCRNANAIRQQYRIDVDVEIDKMLRRMQKTAGDIKDGKIKSAGEYQRCIVDKRCAPIPLLPENVKIDDVSADPTKYTDIRTAFWDLADKKGLTIEICSAMTLCRAMAATGAISFSNEDKPADQSLPVGIE